MRGKTFENWGLFSIHCLCTSFKLMLTNSCQIVSEIQANTGLEPVTSDRSGVPITWCCTLIMMEQWQGTHKSHYILTGSRKFPPSGLPVDYEQGLQDIKLTISALIEHVNTYSAELSTCINKYSTTMSIITNQYTYHGRPSDSLPHLTICLITSGSLIHMWQLLLPRLYTFLTLQHNSTAHLNH